MKKVEAIVKPSKLEAIQRALSEAGIPCMTVTPVKGAGLQRGYTEIYRGTEKSMILLSKVKIECIVSDDNLEKCVAVITDTASEGQVGDGKLFIYDVIDAVRLRTKTRGVEAIR
ncbi:MAG: P-II family nitrogen regulator [Fibrobacterales bacterium]